MAKRFRSKRKKSTNTPSVKSREVFALKNKDQLVDGGYVFGFDPPSGKNMGWAVMQFSDGMGKYVSSGLEKVPDDDMERLIRIYEFVHELKEKYHPVVASLMERSIGFGWAPAREKLGENTGIIKFASLMIGAEVMPIHTSTMGDIFAGTGGMGREEKKLAIQNKAKLLLPRSLNKKRVAQNGVFSHEADALGFAYCFFMTNEIPILNEEALDVIS